MRDDQVLMLIRKEAAHTENMALLRNQQMRMRVESIMEAVSEPVTIFKCIFKKGAMRARVEEIYTKKAKEYNEKLKASLEQNAIREKLKI